MIYSKDQNVIPSSCCGLFTLQTFFLRQTTIDLETFRGLLIFFYHVFYTLYHKMALE